MPKIDRSWQQVPREARRSPLGIGGVSYPWTHDPTHERAHNAVAQQHEDWSEVRDDQGRWLFRAFRVSATSYAWQTAQMPAPAFASYTA